MRDRTSGDEYDELVLVLFAALSPILPRLRCIDWHCRRTQAVVSPRSPTPCRVPRLAGRHHSKTSHLFKIVQIRLFRFAIFILYL